MKEANAEKLGGTGVNMHDLTMLLASFGNMNSFTECLVRAIALSQSSSMLRVI